VLRLGVLKNILGVRNSRGKPLYCELLRNHYLPDNIVINIVKDV
jgi:hypothetical protein